MNENTAPLDELNMNSDELHAHYTRIFEITLQLGSTYDHVALLQKIVFAAKELINTEAASILLMDEASGKLSFAMSTNIKPHEMEQLLVPLEGSTAGWIFTHGEPRVISDENAKANVFQGVGKKIDFIIGDHGNISFENNLSVRQGESLEIEFL